VEIYLRAERKAPKDLFFSVKCPFLGHHKPRLSPLLFFFVFDLHILFRIYDLNFSTSIVLVLSFTAWDAINTSIARRGFTCCFGCDSGTIDAQ
jgi:hypothetical protein